MSNTKELTYNDAIKEEHFLIIDEYFSNGMNGSKALKKYRPGITDATSRSLFNTICKTDHVKKYINDKRQMLRASVNIEPEQVINELLNWMHSDATEYINMTPQEIKQLPEEARRCIQSIKHKKKTFNDPKGNPITEENLEVRIIDKAKTVEILNKMLGNYALDNKQKQSNINIGNLNVNELKVLANILNKAE